MERLLIKKLIVISQSESRSLEIPFENGLNIILGGNKTGKSSIIKSIFTTFGCECTKIETEWKNIISSYLLFFEYGDKSYCIVRQGKKFQIFENIINDYLCIINTNVFQEYSDCLMKILDVKMTCITNKGEQINITPPLLFRFQYIDQDDGWWKIADSFRNVNYIKDWKKHTNKYVCGYLDDTYYNLQASKAKLLFERDDKKKEMDYNQKFVSKISSTLSKNEEIESIEDVMNKIESLLLKSEKMKKQKFMYNNEMAILENDIYVNQQKIHIIMHNLREIKKDIEFAMNQKDELVCPVCGALYLNGLNEQLNLTSDYAQSENLLKELNKTVSFATNKLDDLSKKYNDISLEIKSIEQELFHSQELLSYSKFYMNKGQGEIYETCMSQLDVLKEEFDSLVLNITEIDKKINEMKSIKRSKMIKKRIEEYCATLSEAINLPNTYIKIRDFVQILEHTGSETPRLIYMYQSALYLYNLNRAKSPFNFYIVDTPNQQGQDAENLESIFNSLELISSNNGQVIIGTERETGMEQKANRVIRLTEKRRCLNNKNYLSHLKLFEKLQKNASKWTSNNYN